MAQLEIFHLASYKVSRRDKATRMFYLERAVEEVLSNVISALHFCSLALKSIRRRGWFCPGDGHVRKVSPHPDRFSTCYPWWAQAAHSLQDVSVRRTSGIAGTIILKAFAFRTELANREHMLDHGQLGPPTPAVAFSPVSSRRPSAHDLPPRRPSSSSSRRPSGGASTMTMPRPRRGSASGPTRHSPLTSVEGSNGPSGLAASFSMSALDDDESKNIGQEGELPMSSAPQSQRRRGSSFGDDLRSRLLAGLSVGIPSNLSMSALDSDDDESVSSATAPPATASTPRVGGIPPADTVSSPLAASETSETISEDTVSAPIAGKSHPPPVSTGVSTLQHGADLAAQLHANPKLAALRSPGGLSMTPLQSASRVIDKSSISPPILMNPKCSGYFVEPVG
jgi:dual specificity phosphatase 12